MSELIPLREPVVAYRGWFARPVANFTAESLNDWVEAIRPMVEPPFALFPMTSIVAWTSGTNTAVCRPPSYYEDKVPVHHGIAPDAECGCGLHSHPRMANVHSGYMMPYGLTPQWIIGAVLTWGAMYCGGKTIRAEHAEVIALASQTDGDLAAGLIARTYGVPCVPRTHLRDVALEHGHELPDEVLHEINGGGWL